jgi:hypothetical protein
MMSLKQKPQFVYIGNYNDNEVSFGITNDLVKNMIDMNSFHPYKDFVYKCIIQVYTEEDADYIIECCSLCFPSTKNKKDFKKILNSLNLPFKWKWINISKELMDVINQEVDKIYYKKQKEKEEIFKRLEYLKKGWLNALP